jgi:hypothetical protein
MAFPLWAEVGLGVMGLVTAMIVSIQKIKEARARKINKIAPNPKRCIEEAERITKLEAKNEVWLARFDAVDRGIEDLKTGQKTLLDLHLKP